MPLMQIYTDDDETKKIEALADKYGESKVDVLKRIIKSYRL